MHQRDAVAALASFMKWVETKMVTPSLRDSSTSKAPETVAGHRIDARGRLVEDQHVGRGSPPRPATGAGGCPAAAPAALHVDVVQAEAVDHLLARAAGDALAGRPNRRACSSRFCRTVSSP
jgi:hypothetical protein